jgi:hypothetical protein
MHARGVLIVRRQEKLAERLLDRALEPIDGVEPDLIVQLDVFEKIGKWVSIKNRLEDQGETQIDAFKRRIHAQEVETGPRRGARTKLETIKSRLPDRGDSRTNGDSGDLGDEVSAAAE